MLELRLAPVSLFLSLLVGCSGAGMYGRQPTPYQRQIAAFKAQLSDGTLASFSAGAATQADNVQGDNLATLPVAPAFHEYVAPEQVAELDRAKFWWTDTPRPRKNEPASIALVITNPTDRPLHGVSFSLAEQPCGTPSPSVQKDLILPTPIAPASKAAVLFDIEIGKDSILRRNQLPCGEVRQAW